jgi:hypothetical protein
VSRSRSGHHDDDHGEGRGNHGKSKGKNGHK